MSTSRILFVLLFCTLSFAQPPKATKTASGAGPDNALMQHVMDAWSTLDPANAATFYASGPHVFYDLAPLKYENWTEYEAGAKTLLANYQSLKLVVNDDAEVHRHGDLAWATATIKEDAVMKNNKHEMATIRWTVVWENQGGKWLIVHEHVSEPLQ